ncbi:MAG TPA: ATP-binding protein, partial [Actinomycetes bacterium]|nr:ATP-binding protein [Actinomycetes bacterium]
MKRVLLTGMSGTGKSSVVRELVARGYKAVDTDDGWCEPLAEGRQR